MSKKPTKQQLISRRKKEYKRSVKRLWICVLWLMPVMLGLSVLFAELKFQFWLALLLNVVIGGFVCLLVYIISDKLEQRKKEKQLLEPEEFDPFSK